MVLKMQAMMAYATGSLSSAGKGSDKASLIADVRQALYASKICSYAQGMAVIKQKSKEQDWGIDMGGLARIWKVGNSTNRLLLSSYFAVDKQMTSIKNLIDYMTKPSGMIEINHVLSV